MAIGKEIRNELNKQDRSIAWLSKESGIKATTLRSIISRDSWNIQEEQLWKICAALNIEPHDLLGVKSIQLTGSNTEALVQILLGDEFRVIREQTNLVITSKNKYINISEENLQDSMEKLRSYFRFLIFEENN